jgi:hypothetical protein
MASLINNEAGRDDGLADSPPARDADVVVRAQQYLTLKELSLISGYSTSSIRRWVRQEMIPCYQPGGKGGHLRFPPNAIERCQSLSRSQSDSEGQASAQNSRRKLPGRAPKWTS